MKRTFALMLATTLFLSATLSAQIRKIPSAVTSAFSTKYTGTKNVSWSDKITAFQADFDMDTHHYQASFSSKGEWKRTEKTITAEELPSAVTDGLNKSKYKDWTFKDWKEVIYKDGSHEFRLYGKKNDLQKKYLFFGEDGQLLRDAITL
jgi:hypothetical protein